MGSNVGGKARSWQRSAIEVEDMNFSGATAGQRTAPELHITVAEDEDGKVDLIAVTTETAPAFETVNSNADILCLDLHEFEIDRALSWIKNRQEFANAQYGGPACIAVLADPNTLSVSDFKKVSWEIERAGAMFRPWPESCQSFDEAISALAKSIKQTYQVPVLATR